MNEIKDLIINLLAAAIGFVIACIGSALQRAFKVRRAQRFWRPFIDGTLHLVFPVVDQPAYAAWDSSGIAGIGDVIALTELDKHLRSIRLHDYDIHYSHLMAGERLNSNLVLIAGPDANRISHMVMERLPLTFVFKQDDVAILDNTNGTSYRPTKGKEVIPTTDWGLIVRASNPFNSERQVLIIAGSYGFGTAAAATLVTTPTFL
jgi:hypothetical protein